MKNFKKIIFASLFLFAMHIGIYNVAANSITLEKIVEEFNASSIVSEYEAVGGSISAVNDDGSISITLNANETTENIELLFEENILSIEIDEEEENAFAKVYITLKVLDVIGQIHGYREGELIKTLSSDEAMGYTLEEEGFEMYYTSETKFRIMTDITKKIPLLDFSNTYIEVSDIEYLKEFISGDGSAEDQEGNVWFNKSGYDGKYTLLVAEEVKLTENAYKSILSILQVMFDNESVVKYFKENYSSISIGDKEFAGFSIKVNPKDKTELEEFAIPSDSEHEFVRIVIDKGLVLSSVTEKEKVTYKITEGADQKYEVGKTESLTIRIDMNFEMFDAVYVDGKLVDKSNYEVKSGSTVVTLKKEYLDKLNNGEHIVKIIFKDGGIAETKFNVEVKNASTGINLGFGILTLILIISTIGYFLIRKQSKFPKHN